jgi:hypothetical protein
VGVVGPGVQTSHWRSGHQHQLVLGEEFADAGAEGLMALAQGGDLGRADTSAPLQALANERLDQLEVAGVDTRCLMRLDSRKDVVRVGPP